MTAEHAPRGEPSRPPPPTESAASSEPAPPPWNLAAELRRVHPASPRTPSEHLTGQLDGAIFADEGAAAYPALGPLRPIPAGATLIDPAGHVEQRGRLSLCARCHADAPHDHLFGTGR